MEGRKPNWIALPLDLIESDAWRSASIHVRRFVDFLMREHLRHGGRNNGKLIAPHKQIEAFGIGARYVAAAIKEAERLGLVEVERRGERVASFYTLSFLARHDAKDASSAWRQYRNPALRPLPAPQGGNTRRAENLPVKGKAEAENLPVKGKAALPVKGKAEAENLPVKGGADRGNLPPHLLPAKGKALSRLCYHGGAPLKEEEKDQAASAPAAAAAQTCTAQLVDLYGKWTVCGRPVAAGARDRCAGHLGTQPMRRRELII